MAKFSDLQPGSYYVIQEVENTSLELVYVPLITEKCVLIEFQDDDQTLAWYRKTEEIFEIVEQLTEEQAVIYESLFEDEEEDEEEDDFFWGDDDDEEDDFWDVEDDSDDADDDTISKN